MRLHGAEYGLCLFGDIVGGGMSKIEYFFFKSESLPGVTQKVEHTVKALRCLGYKAHATSISGGFWKKRLSMLKRLILTKADIVVIRYEYLTPVLYLPILIVHRLLRRKIIFDVPTPLSVGAREVYDSDVRCSTKALKLLALYLQGPFVLWVGNLVLQYAPESRYFSLGLRSRTLNTSNGIDTSIFEGFQAFSKVSECVRFVCVGSIAYWHGIDRFVKGMAVYKQSGVDHVRVSLSIVGQGEGVSNLVSLVDGLGLQESVLFLGQLTGEDLFEVYRRSDVGVGTLGLHRKGLNSASPLKNREYCSLGLPLLISHEDPDFNEAKFCMRVDSTDSPVDVMSVIRWYFSLKNEGCSAEYIKSFARESLDYRVKWQKVLEALA